MPKTGSGNDGSGWGDCTALGEGSKASWYCRAIAVDMFLGVAFKYTRLLLRSVLVCGVSQDFSEGGCRGA